MAASARTVTCVLRDLDADLILVELGVSKHGPMMCNALLEVACGWRVCVIPPALLELTHGPHNGDGDP